MLRTHLKMHSREKSNHCDYVCYPPHANFNMLLQVIFGFDYFLAFVTDVPTWFFPTLILFM